MNEAAAKKFTTWAIITLVTLFVLILAGGIVRSTGSGMGCPDWPKCFGQYIPPTSVDELPENYQEIYKEHGYADTTFNVYKTYTEYINRLIGALTGFFLLITLYYSKAFISTNRPVFIYTLAAFLLTGFQGWVGAKVVATNLKSYLVSIHMLIALVILAILLLAIGKALQHKWQQATEKVRSYRWLALATLLITVLQIIVGTEVREHIDEWAALLGQAQKAEWLNRVSDLLAWHKTIGTITMGLSVFLLWVLRTHAPNSLPHRLAIVAVALMGLQLFIGFTLTQYTLPPISQALHIFVATLIFGVQFSSVMLLFHKKEAVI